MRIASLLTVAGIAAMVGVGTSASATQTYISLPGMSGVPETEDWSQFTRYDRHGAVEGIINDNNPHYIDFPIPVILGASAYAPTVSAWVTVSSSQLGTAGTEGTPGRSVNCQLATFTATGEDSDWWYGFDSKFGGAAEQRIWLNEDPIHPGVLGKKLTVPAGGTAAIHCAIKGNGSIKSVNVLLE